MASAAPTLTLQDIADLARVRRPVVSMWRRRPMARGRFLPFPEPIGSAGGVEQFSRDDIVDWLERTGRGNNEETRLVERAERDVAGRTRDPALSAGDHR